MEGQEILFDTICMANLQRCRGVFTVLRPVSQKQFLRTMLTIYNLSRNFAPNWPIGVCVAGLQVEALLLAMRRKTEIRKHGQYLWGCDLASSILQHYLAPPHTSRSQELSVVATASKLYRTCLVNTKHSARRPGR